MASHTNTVSSSQDLLCVKGEIHEGIISSKKILFVDSQTNTNHNNNMEENGSIVRNLEMSIDVSKSNATLPKEYEDTIPTHDWLI